MELMEPYFQCRKFNKAFRSLCIVQRCEFSQVGITIFLCRYNENLSKDLHYQFIPSGRGKYCLLMLDNHTFNQVKKDNRYWNCSKRTTKGCRAKVHFDKDHNIVSYVKEHNHSPPRYYLNHEYFFKFGPSSLEEPDNGTRLIYEGEHPEEVANVGIFVKSRKGKTVLQYKGFRYRKAYKSRCGTRWGCSLKKSCGAFIYLNDRDEITMANEEHNHPQPLGLNSRINNDETDTAVVITSRRGRELLLFRKYTYRKQYEKSQKCRWICSTLKNCRAYVFTDNNNYIVSAFEEHCHSPPKYYLKPDHVINALREPLIIETD